MNPKGKTTLITGGAHQVGKAITLGLAQAGANVRPVVNDGTTKQRPCGAKKAGFTRRRFLARCFSVGRGKI